MECAAPTRLGGSGSLIVTSFELAERESRIGAPPPPLLSPTRARPSTLAPAPRAYSSSPPAPSAAASAFARFAFFATTPALRCSSVILDGFLNLAGDLYGTFGLASGFSRIFSHAAATFSALRGGGEDGG